MGYNKVVEILFDYKVEINYVDNDGRIVLVVIVFCVLVSENYEVVVDFFLKRGVEVDYFDFDGLILFCVVVFEGYYNVVKLLIKVGVDIGYWDRNGRIFLFVVAVNGYCDIVDLFFEIVEGIYGYLFF